MDNDKITELAQAIVKEKMTPEEMDKVFQSLRKQVIESALEAELDAHLGYSKYAPEGRNSGNGCNGKSRKELREYIKEKGIEDRVLVPEDGETLSF